MSKVKLIVRKHGSLDDGRVVDIDLRVPESENVIGIIRTDFDTADDGSSRASDNIDPIVPYERINDLVGRLLTMIDATFTDKEQREAMKDLYKQIAWDWYGKQKEPLHRPWDKDRIK